MLVSVIRHDIASVVCKWVSINYCSAHVPINSHSHCFSIRVLLSACMKKEVVLCFDRGKIKEDKYTYYCVSCPDTSLNCVLPLDCRVPGEASSHLLPARLPSDLLAADF